MPNSYLRLQSPGNGAIVALCVCLAACATSDNPIEPIASVAARTRTAGAAYAFVDLGTLGGCCSRAADINARGQVVGSSEVPPGDDGGSDEDRGIHPFLWQDGVMTDLGGDFLGASGINASGAVTVTGGPGDFNFAYVFKQGVLTNLPGSGEGDQVASGINARGEVVGTDIEHEFHPVVWDHKGAIHNLGTLGGAVSFGRGINDAGDAVGVSITIDLKDHAFLWSKGVMTDLGTLGGDLSVGNAINSAGAVVGCSSLEPGSFVEHAFVWEKGVMTDLGTLGGVESCAFDIDGAGRIVGQAATSAGVPHAVLWDNGVSIDLGALAGEGGSAAAAINSQGTVVGVFQPFPAQGIDHAAMWVRK